VSEAGASDDGGAPILLDSGAQDTESLDSEAIDTMVLFLDAKADISVADAPADLPGSDLAEAYPEVDHDLPVDLPADLPVDTTPDPFACPSVTVKSGGNTGNFGTTGILCFVTCDSIQGWGGSNLTGRQIKVNKVAVTLPTTGSDGQMPLPASSQGNYYLFQVTAGSLGYASINWWGTANATCPAPDGGFYP
jgi:hypothetical protein